MDAAIGATLAAIGKKLLIALAGDKNGRKFLGYFEGKAKPTVEQMNPYLSELFHDFTEYLYLGGFLEPYGWSREDVEEAILEKLPDDVREICAEELGPKEEETDIGGMTM